MSIYTIHTRVRRGVAGESVFGLFVVQDVSAVRSLLKASLDNRVLRHGRMAGKKGHFFRNQLLPLSFLLCDSAAKRKRLPILINPTQLDCLSTCLTKTCVDSRNKTSRVEMDSIQPSRLDDDGVKEGKVGSGGRVLGKGKLRISETGVTNASVRLDLFFKAIRQCNVFSLSLILDQEPQLITDVTHPENGYSPIILAMLTRCKRKRRVLLHLMTETLSHVLLANNESLVCDRVLLSHDTMLGRDCIAWACYLGLLNEATALYNLLLVSVDFRKPDFLGETYLHLAVRSGSLRLVKWLTARMYDLGLPCTRSVNYSGCTSLDVARQMGATEIAECLQQTDQRLFDYLPLRRRENAEYKVK